MKLRWLSATAFGLAAGVLWLLAAAPAHASHYVYTAHNADFVDFADEEAPYRDGSYTWAVTRWAIDGQTLRYCNGLGGLQATWDAVAEWNSVYPWPFQEFTSYCGPEQQMDVVDNVSWGPYPCGALIGCMRWTGWVYDPGRGGSYGWIARIWINERDYDFTYWGLRYVMTHELGHVYGLDEQYLHDPIRCNGGVYSVMDAASVSGSTVVGGCDVNTISWDALNNAHEFYVMTTAAFQPLNYRSVKFNANTMDVYWNDASPTESGYPMYFYYWIPSQERWQLINSRTKSSGIAPGDPWVTPLLGERFARPGGYPTTWYRVCMYVRNGVIGNRYERCTMQFLG